MTFLKYSPLPLAAPSLHSESATLHLAVILRRYSHIMLPSYKFGGWVPAVLPRTSLPREARPSCRCTVAGSDDLLTAQVVEHCYPEGRAKRQYGVEPILPLRLRHVREVHPVDAGYEGQGQEDGRYGGQPSHALVYSLGLFGVAPGLLGGVDL